MKLPDEIPWKDPSPMSLSGRVVAEAEMVVRLATLTPPANDE